MKPVLFKIFFEDFTESNSSYKRKLSWFDEKLIVCYLHYGNNWMRAYLTKYIEEIKLEARLKGFRFFWTEDPNMDEFADLSIVKNTQFTVNDAISHHFFGNLYSMSGIFRLVDGDHFIGWDYRDMVKSSTDISFPKELYEELGSVEQYGDFINIFQEGGVTFESDTEHFSPDPENDEHDHYFEQFSCKCEKCGAVDIYKIPKEMDFYGGMESETECARCGKDSWEVCSSDIGYYWDLEYGGWHPCFLSIPAGTGYCNECKPYYVSDIANLEFRCNCGGVMKR